MKEFFKMLKSVPKMFLQLPVLAKAVLLYVFFTMTFFSAKAQWAKSVGGIRADFGQAVAVDAAGNLYVTGNFAGTADFDPGPAVHNLQSSCPCDPSDPPFSDAFLAKYDAAGNYLWAFNIGGGDADLGQAVSLDGAGNVYVTGLFRITADFDPGTAVHNLTSAGNTDIFLAKYDANGNYLWANSFGSGGADGGYGLKADATGILLTGSFFGAVDFDPGAGVTSFNAGSSTDVFFARYNATGTLVWAKDIEGTGEQGGHSITSDGAGNIYLTGVFFGTDDLDPGPGVAAVTGAGAKDPFFAKYDAAGNFIWGKSIGSTSDQEALVVAVDASGNFYTTGYFLGTVDFDPGPGIFTLTNSPGGGFDMFMLKLNTNGDFQWAFKVGNTGSDIALSVALDSGGNPYICGGFQGTVDFDPGAGTFSMTASGNDGFFAKYSPAGNFLFAQKEGGTAEDFASSIGFDAANNAYLTGYYAGTSPFVTGAGTTSLISAGLQDIFILKFQGSAILPVHFLSFAGKKTDSGILLEWTTASEIASDGFDIEKMDASQALAAWQKIGFVPSVQPSNTSNTYSFKDNTLLTGKVLYRLRQVDKDGQFRYSTIVTIDAAINHGYTLGNSPNPAQQTTTISYSVPEKTLTQVTLYNTTGQQLAQLVNAEKVAGYYTLSLDCSHLKAGTYYYTLRTAKAIIVKKLTVLP